MYVRLAVSGRPPQRTDPARCADRHSPNAAPLVRAAEDALARDPQPFPMREGFGLTVVTGFKLPKRRGYGIDDPIVEILVDVGLIVDEREQLAACDAQVRNHLEPGEHVLAVGRCEDVTEEGRMGPLRTFVMVTDRAVRWIANLDPRSKRRSISTA